MKEIEVHFYIKISQYIDYVKWDMELDITYICERAGMRDRWYDQYYKAHSYIPFTLTHARKIFRLIKNYADEETIIKTEKYVKEYCEKINNKKVIEQWEKA